MEGIRAFICAEVPDECKELILKRARQLNAGSARFVGREQLHITLFFFANLALGKVDALKEIIGNLDYKSFDVKILGFGVFNPRKPTVVFAKVEDLGNLLDIYNRLAPGIKKLGLELEEREFTPHLTIARIRDANRDTIESIEAFVGESTAEICSFKCTRIKLVQSTLTENGPVYEELYTKELAKS